MECSVDILYTRESNLLVEVDGSVNPPAAAAYRILRASSFIKENDMSLDVNPEELSPYTSKGSVSSVSTQEGITDVLKEGSAQDRINT